MLLVRQIWFFSRLVDAADKTFAKLLTLYNFRAFHLIWIATAGVFPADWLGVA